MQAKSPLKTYEKLKESERCIYQAFQNVHGNKDTASAMGKYVNEKNVDADDDEAVNILSEKYGFNQVRMFLGKEILSKLEANSEYILSINAQKKMIADFETTKPDGIEKIKAFQKKYENEIGHTLYCKTQKLSNKIEAWEDSQGLYKADKFPTADTVVVAHGRKRID